MKIAIYSAINCHYEMYGYIIDYCYKNNYNLDIYSLIENNMGWLEFYKKKYPNYFKIIDLPYFFIVNDYDRIILTTDNDYSFSDDWIKYIEHKMICIDHYKDRRRSNISKHINIRYFPNRSTDDWALPVYRIIDLEEKMKISKNNIMVIGNNIKNFDIENFIDHEKYNFILCSREIENKFEQYKNVSCYEELSTDEMINFLNHSDYVFIYDKNDHVDKSMSGAIPLAFNCLCTLIIPEEMYKKYDFGFNSVITYKDKINVRKANYKKVNNDLEKLIKIRNSVFDKYLYNKNTAIICEPRKINNLSNIIKQYQKILKDWHFVFYCGRDLKKYWSKILDNIEIRELPYNNLSPEEYNNLFKLRFLWESLYGEYVLVFQADTWIHEDVTYNIDYFMKLNKSYIGGNMSYTWNELNRDFIFPKIRNFNGGLSLRKRKDMIKVLSHYKVSPNVPNSESHETDAEDVYFVIGCYKLGLPVGDDEESSHFSVHTIYKDKWFGLHKPVEDVKEKLFNDYPELKKLDNI